MGLKRAAALLYGALAAGVVLFQVALAAGMPWGAYAMGGAFPGRFPPPLRIAALAQAVLIAGMGLVVLSRAGIVLPGWVSLGEPAGVGGGCVRGRECCPQRDDAE